MLSEARQKKKQKNLTGHKMLNFGALHPVGRGGAGIRTRVIYSIPTQILKFFCCNYLRIFLTPNALF